MALKRKRSSSAVSPFSSSSSATLSSRDPSASPCPDVHMFDDSSCAVPRPDFAPSDLHSRTRKRYRDNRPDEAIVHGMYSIHLSRPSQFLLSLSIRQEILTKCRNHLSKTLRRRAVSSSYSASCLQRRDSHSSAARPAPAISPQLLVYLLTASRNL